MAGCGARQAAKRALVGVLLALAAAYQIILTVSRESSDKDVVYAFRRMALKVHPDKGGSTGDMQRLAEAKENFDKAKQNFDNACGGKAKSKGKGRSSKGKGKAKAKGGQGMAAIGDDGADRPYRIRGHAVLLTYQRFADIDATWGAFLSFVDTHLKSSSQTARNFRNGVVMRAPRCRRHAEQVADNNGEAKLGRVDAQH